VATGPPPIGGAERAGDTRGGAGGAAGRQVRHRRRFCPLAFSGYFLVTSRRHTRELCRQEVAEGGYKESHTVDQTDSYPICPVSGKICANYLPLILGINFSTIWRMQIC